MPFTFEFLEDGRVVEWELTPRGAAATVRDGYTPRFYAAPRSPSVEVDLGTVRAWYDRHPDVVDTALVERRPGFRRRPTVVLAVDVAHIDRVAPLARQTRHLPGVPAGDLACFNVDHTRGFRYCLEIGIDPTPTRDPTTLRLTVPRPEHGAGTYDELTVGDETITGDTEELLDAVRAALDATNPDVLVCSTTELVPTLHAMAREAGRDEFTLGRVPDRTYQQRAEQSTYTSYGRVGHSPARYSVAGRALIDVSNTFFYDEAGLDGCLDLVRRSHKPLQELAWASIGNVLTAIQIREAHTRNILTPWRAWHHEQFKTAGTLHDADRGGFIFAPDVGVHENVHELDFASLYPNIICTRNISPETIRCDCHHDRADVPELDYAICDDQGYLVDVLQPLVDAREEYKDALVAERTSDDPDHERIASLERRSSALKWILVACFGYQGFDNAKFGRIECHEAINAFAREILLTAKDRLEAGGWRVVHGIVDSIWVTPDPGVSDDDRTDLEALAAAITDAVDVRLEYEAAYDWVAFVPQRGSQAGALTRYFGKLADPTPDADEFKLRGIEARQRSTPPFVAAVQRECIRAFDEARAPEAVIARLDRAVTALQRGVVDADRLVRRVRASKPVDDYTHGTRTVAALERARDRGRSVHPGQDVAYVVVDDDRDGRERVVLAHETGDGYDAGYYETCLVRAVTSVLAPLGWDQSDVERALGDTRETTLSGFGGGVE